MDWTAKTVMISFYDKKCIEGIAQSLYRMPVSPKDCLGVSFHSALSLMNEKTSRDVDFLQVNNKEKGVGSGDGAR